MDDEILILIDGMSKRTYERKIQRWLDLSAMWMTPLRFINVHDMPTDEIIDATIETMAAHDIQRVAVSTLDTISGHISEAAHWILAVIEAGRKPFVISFAEEGLPLAELKRNAAEYILDTRNYSLVDAEDILFLRSYLDSEINLQQLYSWLHQIDISFDPADYDEFVAGLMRDVRIAALMAQVLEYKEQKMRGAAQETARANPDLS